MPNLYDGTAENNHLVIGKNVTEVDEFHPVASQPFGARAAASPMKNFKGNTSI